MKILLSIPKNQIDLRLDQVVSNLVETCSRKQAADLISSGEVQVSGMKKRPGYRVKQEDIITARIPEPVEEVPPGPEAMDLSILFEDDHILVIDKPPGMVVHPGAGNLSGTLVNGLLDYFPFFNDEAWPPLRPGIVHRLDKDTSGLILVAKNLESLGFLQREFKQRRVEKRYLALVEGVGIADEGEIILPLGRHPVKRKMMAVNHETGKYAKTTWRVMERFAKGCLIDVRLHTGRTHQIRVHVRAMDMPLFGDKVYQYRKNRRKKNDFADRQMLHSWRLRFRHPYSGREIKFETKIPTDFPGTMAKLGLPG